MAILHSHVPCSNGVPQPYPADQMAIIRTSSLLDVGPFWRLAFERDRFGYDSAAITRFGNVRNISLAAAAGGRAQARPRRSWSVRRPLGFAASGDSAKPSWFCAAMVENEQDQPPATGVSRHGKVLRDLKSDLIRIGAGTAVTLRRGSGGCAGTTAELADGSRLPFAWARAASGHRGTQRNLSFHVADIFSGAADDNFFLSSRGCKDFTSAILDAIRCPPLGPAGRCRSQ